MGKYIEGAYLPGAQKLQEAPEAFPAVVALTPAQRAAQWLSAPSETILDSIPPPPKILLIDIENSPALAYVWGLFHEDINLQRLVQPKELLCFAARWLGSEETFWYSAQDKDNMLMQLHKLLDEADGVIHYNGDSHDMPIINAEFLKAGFPPPSPYKNIDLYKTIKRDFLFTSAKLEHVAKELGLRPKLADGGFETWAGCMRNEQWAWDLIRVYNIGDLDPLEDLYFRVLPWIQQHVSFAAFSHGHCCPNCGSLFMVKRGYAHTKVSVFQRWRCNDCGKWSRSTTRVANTGITEIAA